MKKLILAATAAFFTLNGFAQIYIAKDKSAKIKFFSSTPVENIDATNEAITSILNASNDSVMVRVPINSFIFPKSLMQEHFNENYMESAKYPQASFRGKINEKVDFTKNGETKVTCTGDLKIHGVTKPVTLNGTIKVAEGKVILDSKFMVKLTDYNIDVPKIVFQNIAEEIQVTMTSTYSPYVKK
jgi:polyisoprenoid-binding protein YceI